MAREGHHSREDDHRERNGRLSSSSHSSRHRHKRSRRQRNSLHANDPRPHRRERMPRPSTHIYLSSANAASVSLRTDHVLLASSLSSMVEHQHEKIDDILAILKRCCPVYDTRQQLQREGTAPQVEASESISSGYRVENSSNVASMRKSTEESRNPKPRCVGSALICVTQSSFMTIA